MTVRTIRLAILPIALAAGLAVPAAGTAARGCPADTRLVHSMLATLGRSLPLSAEQVKLLLQVASLQSSRQPVPADLLDRLRSLTNRNRRVLAAGERSLSALPPGTPQGRAFKRTAISYLHEAARPMNECIADAVEAKTVAELGASVRCFEAARSRDTRLQRSLNAAMNQMKQTRRCTIRR